MGFKEIIVWFFVILVGILVFWYVFGDSPTFEQTALGIILVMGISTLVKLNVLETRFNYLARDFRAHVRQKKH